MCSGRRGLDSSFQNQLRAVNVNAPITGDLEFYLQAFNILNHTNLTGYTGNLTSVDFGQATSAGPARRIELGMNFGF